MPRPKRTGPRSFKRPGPAASPGRDDAPGAPRRPPPLGDAPRDLICRTLARQARLAPEFDLLALDRATGGPDATGLSPLDAAFVHAVVDAAMRRWLTLNYLLARHVSQPWDLLEPKVRGVLLAGAAQILLLDKVPVHAAINHAVEWAKLTVRPGAGGLVNAVLRKTAALRPPEGQTRRERYADGRDELPAPDGSAIVLAEPVLPEGELDRLAIATSHPRWLLERWLKMMPMREVRRLALHSLADPPTILNTAHATGDLPADLLRPHAAPGHHVFTGTHAQLADLLRRRRDLWVQDPASSAAVAGIVDLRPSLILDLCAGLGTKTRQLAAVFPDARIVATDVDQPRFGTLASVFKGSGRVSVLPPRQVREIYLQKADLILLDVPCSNTGVLARRPEARYRLDSEHLASLTGIQRQIIADSIPLLTPSPRGRILYSSCSLEPEENDAQAAWADRWHRLGVTRQSRVAPQGGPGLEPHVYSDGAFAALLGE